MSSHTTTVGGEGKGWGRSGVEPKGRGLGVARGREIEGPSPSGSGFSTGLLDPFYTPKGPRAMENFLVFIFLGFLTEGLPPEIP